MPEGREHWTLKTSPNHLLRELKKINYPILWDGHLARPLLIAGKNCPLLIAGKMPAPQEGLADFFIWKSLISALLPYHPFPNPQSQKKFSQNVAITKPLCYN